MLSEDIIISTIEDGLNLMADILIVNFTLHE